MKPEYRMKISRDTGPIHFVGMGGIGMSGIAQVMANLGFRVQGSDRRHSDLLRNFEQQSIPVFIGHSADNLGDAQILVISTAISRDNPEIQEAIRRRIPIVQRAEMLAELMRFKRCIAIAGSHGKTTTTTLMAALLEEGGFDPTVINGGIINSHGANAYLGEGEWTVVEADESDGSFLKLPTDVGLVTNLDPEHLDFYGSFDNLIAAVKRFIENIPFFGFAVICNEDENLRQIIDQVRDRRIITYGRNDDADVQLVRFNPVGNSIEFTIRFNDARHAMTGQSIDFTLPMPGWHNALNAAGAVAIASELGLSKLHMQQAYRKFQGVNRRFTHVGTCQEIDFYDDYGHHPAEIEAVLAAAKLGATGRVIAVMQPHRYSRLASLFDDFAASFADADVVIVTPVYAAGEVPIDGVSSESLVEKINAMSDKQAYCVADQDSVLRLLREQARAHDVVIFLGAGDITAWARDISKGFADCA